MKEVDLFAGVDVGRALRRALARGGDFADAFAEDKETCLIEVEAQRVERLVQGRRGGAGLRVIQQGRTSYSYADPIETAALLECAETAALAVKNGGPTRVAAAGRWRRWSRPVERPFDETPLAKKLELVFRAERAARKFDRRVRQTRVVFASQRRRIAVANSLGTRTSDAVSQLVFHVFVVAADGDELQTAHESMGGTVGMELFSSGDPEEIALVAARRAVRNLEAAPAPSGVMPVVLAAEAGGTMIHEAIGHGLEADLAEEGLSVYQDRLGQRIASPLITVIDDATLAGKRGSFSIDDEGTPAQRTVLVERGVLKGYLYDLKMAMKMGRVSTGNGRRESYAYPPIVRMTNTMIAPGRTPPSEIVKSVDRGLLVRRMGGGEVNTVNGDFVFEVDDGVLIENGEPTEAARGATLTGNGPRVLREIDLVGSDLGFGIGTCGKDGQGAPVSDAQPTLRIPRIIVGGRIGKK